MRRIYHIVSRAAWDRERDPDYRHPSLAAESFIHCSYREQVARVANRFFAGQHDLVVLGIDAAALGAMLLTEDCGTGEIFPHVYGPIPRRAVIEVLPLHRGADGQWVFEGAA